MNAISKASVRGLQAEQVVKQAEKYNPNPKAARFKDAFDFDQTDEGRAYWELVDKLFTLQPEVKSRIEEQLQVLPPDIREEVRVELNKIPNRQNKDLKFAFKWGESPQGKTFWKLVSQLIKVHQTSH